MLERKKILIQTDAQESASGKFLIYERKHTGEVFIVKDPRLRLDELESVQQEVSLLLGGKKPGEKSGATPSETQQETSQETAGEPARKDSQGK